MGGKGTVEQFGPVTTPPPPFLRPHPCHTPKQGDIFNLTNIISTLHTWGIDVLQLYRRATTPYLDGPRVAKISWQVSSRLKKVRQNIEDACSSARAFDPPEGNLAIL